MSGYLAFRMSIVGCARCQGEGHEGVFWEPLTYPVETDRITFTHWAPCPTNGQPILMSAAPGGAP